MKYLPALAVVCLLIVPSVALAQQISPNPNPSGNLLLVDHSDAYNESDKFDNYGTIAIDGTGTLRNDGTLTNNLGGTLGSFGNLNNYWTLTNDGALTNYTGGTLTNIDILNNNAALTNNGGILNNLGTLDNNGTLNNTNQGTLTNTNHGTINNSGTLINNDYSTINNSGTLTNNDGGTLTNNGSLITTDGTFTNNGTLNGSGRIKGSYTDHGKTKPGNSAGVMTIDGDYFKVAGSKEIELGGLFNGGGDKSLTEFDWIDVTGNVELAGLLHVDLIDGFELHRGNWFDILRVGGTLSGQYEGLGEGDLVGHFGGQDLFITYGGTGDGGGVALYTNPVPEPTTVLIWSMLAGLGMTVRRRR